MTVLCREVWIHFINLSKAGQRIMYTDCSGADKMAVSATEQFVSVTFLHKDATPIHPNGKPLKVICFNKDQVHEFSCENSLMIADNQ